MAFDASQEPLSHIQWVHVRTLARNDYNPNMVMKPELRLLEFNILRHGWLQPVLSTRSGIIIDGFHRYMLSRESKPLSKRYNGHLPVIQLDLRDDEAILLTVRMNRAKGVHAATRMAGLVRSLEREHGYSRDDIAASIGGTRTEVDILADDDLFTTERLDKHVYSKAWYPGETRNETKA